MLPLYFYMNLQLDVAESIIKIIVQVSRLRLIWFFYLNHKTVFSKKTVTIIEAVNFRLRLSNRIKISFDTELNRLTHFAMKNSQDKFF